jgi:hypothetical protein
MSYRIVATPTSPNRVGLDARMHRVMPNPITGIAVCCARATSGQGAAVPPTSVMNSRHLDRIACNSPRQAGAAPQDIELEPIRQQAAQLTAEASGSGPLDRRPAWMISGATRSQRMVALITRWMVAVSFELTDPTTAIAI